MNTKLLITLWLISVGSLSAVAQSKAIQGKVLSGEDKTPIPGVSILEKGTTSGTVTDAEGNYSLTVKENAVLVFSFVGYTSQEVPVSGQTQLDITLQTDLQTLNEVVIIGYGEQERKDVTGSVTAITARDFNKGVLTSPQDLLVGKLAGVQVTPNSGAPGSSATIRIRSGSSLYASNDPLIVIDGFPVDNATISGMSNPLASLNPNDIESFTVLKDASATAIYGSRASNGVIIVTTKKGKEDKLQLSYNGNFSVSSPIKYVDVFDGDEYRQLTADLIESGKVSGLNSAALIRQGTSNTDWQKEIYRNAFSHDHNISVRGAVKNFPYRASYGYTDQQGILKTTSMQRHTLNVSLTPSFLDDNLKVTANLKTMLSKSDFGNTGAVGAAVSFDPTQPVMNGNTRYGGYFTWVNSSETLPDGTMDPNGDANTFSINNPVALLDLTDNQSDVTRTIGNIQVDYRLPFLTDLRVNVNAGLDHSNGEGYNNAAPEAAWTYRNYTTGNGELIDYLGKNQSELFDLYLNYVKEFGPSRIDVTGGYSWQHFQREGWTFQRNGDASVVRLSKEDSQYINENFLVSFFGRLNYTFKEKYVVTATLRDDGSSRFSEDNRWGLFPSVAVAWNVSEESFLQGSKSTLKVRLGYGVTGQQDILNNYYPYLPIYRQSIGGASYQFGNTFVPTLRPDPYDANIKWEETTTYNAGLDFSFLNDKISGTIDVYQRETKDLINYIPIAAGSNFSNFLTTNVGDLQNKGIELTLRTKPIAKADINWNVGFNFTYNVNEVTNLTLSDDPNFPGNNVGGIGGGVGNTIQIDRVGYPKNSFYVFEQVYSANGLPIEGLYVDRTDGGGSVSSNNLNKYTYHSPAPKFLMGLNSSFGYKQFDLSFSSRISFNNYVYNNVFSGATYSAIYVQSGFFGNVPKAINETQFVNPQYWSDHYVENASFFKMDNISLGYNINQLSGQKLKARISFTVQNAFIITDYKGLDPEVDIGRGAIAPANALAGNTPGIDNNIYPRPRTFVLGVNLTY